MKVRIKPHVFYSGDNGYLLEERWWFFFWCPVHAYYTLENAQSAALHLQQDCEIYE